MNVINNNNNNIFILSYDEKIIEAEYDHPW